MVQYLKAAGLAFEVEDPSDVGHVFLVPLFLLNESQHSETEKLKLYKEEKLHEFEIVAKLFSPVSINQFANMIKELYDKNLTRLIWKNGIENIDCSCKMLLTYSNNESNNKAGFEHR